MLVRRRARVKAPIEVRVAVIGNVDSGKSTLVGVLTRSVLDDGRGYARSKVSQGFGGYASSKVSQGFGGYASSKVSQGFGGMQAQR